MYNSEQPSRAELPSGKQLLLSTLAAAVVAVVLLLTTILPAEYGVDPTGIGRQLGLTQMGEIKTQLAAEAAQEPAQSTPAESSVTAPPVAEAAAPVAAPAAVANRAANVNPVTTDQEPQVTAQRDQRSFTLKPGAAAEFKLAMRAGARVSYRWSAAGGRINYDTHGDNATTDYFGYGKGRNVDGDEGLLVAAFDGSHGWFWRNRSGAEVTVTLTTEGDYQSIKRVM